MCRSSSPAGRGIRMCQFWPLQDYLQPFPPATQVNKIREVPGHESILVTHTDAPEVLVWSLERQPNRASDKARAGRV